MHVYDLHSVHSWLLLATFRGNDRVDYYISTFVLLRAP